MKFDELYMKNMLSRCYPEEGLSRIPRSSLNYTIQTGGDWTPIRDVLKKWEKAGLLSLVKDPEFSKDDEICVVMKTFFNGELFPSNWIRDNA